jgi:NodT family efflux transporter outer membrane factor (OMF) lipoprotein
MIAFRRFAAGAALAGALAGCTVGPDYHPPQTDLPVQFAAAPDAANQPPAESIKDQAKWWRSFNDPTLDALVEQAIAGNLDLQVALARLQEAKTFQSVTISAELPEVGVSGAAGTGTGSDLTRGKLAPALTAADNRNGSQVVQAVGFDAGVELDLFGQLRREVEAAKDDEQAAEAARSDTIITLIAAVVRDYFDQRGLQMRAAALERSVAIARQTVNFLSQRYNRGLSNQLDLTLAQRELSSLEAQVAPLEAQITATRYNLAVLVGHYPETIDRALDQPAMLPPLPATVELGQPVDLLRRRPDIHEAERQLAGATARIGVATADLFPHLAVSGAVGLQQLSTSVSKSAMIWSLGPAASFPLLDFGALDALVDIADLRTKEFLLDYRQTILRAVQQVDTDSGAYAADQDSLHDLDQALAAGAQSTKLASERYDRGLTDFLNVLDAQREEYALEDQYAVTEEQAADALVSLYQALGGGWEPYRQTPPIRQPQPAIIAAFRRLFQDGVAKD